MRSQPVVFIGHGNPMHAIADDAFTRTLARLGVELSSCKAVLCISAHWLTKGTWVTHMPAPRTIHDFGGFPQALFDVRYPAPGDPKLAERVRELLAPEVEVGLDDIDWGLDHGAWSVLRHLFPKAELPIVQLSLDLARPPTFHYEVGARLRALRDEGVLILGSGNIVHNLRRIRWEEHSPAYTWAIEFDRWVKERLEAGDHRALVEKALDTEAGRLSIPTPDHWYPLLYVLGAAEKGEKLRFEYEGLENGSISMRSLALSKPR